MSWDDNEEDEPRFDLDRAAATDWAKELLARNDWVIFDTETTGLYNAEICQLALLDPDGMVRMDTLVKPCHAIPADASRIHGITDETVKDAPPLDDLIPRLEEIMHGKRVVVYNALFDQGVLTDCLRRRWRRPHQRGGDGLAISYPEPDAPDTERIEAWLERITRWDCAMEVYASYVGHWNDYHQSYRWQRLPAAPGVKAHTALGDCHSTLALIRRMAEGR